MIPRFWTDGERYYEHDGEEITVVQMLGEWVAVNVDHELVGTGLEPATCSDCDGEIQPDAKYPLCDRCSRTAEAHARLERHAREYAMEDGR